MALGRMATVTPLERRQSERFSSGYRSEVRIVGGGPRPATLLDISTEGVCLETELALEVGALVRVGLPRGMTPQARLIWCRDGQMGFQFLVPLAVHDLVQALDPM